MEKCIQFGLGRLVLVKYFIFNTHMCLAQTGYSNLTL